MTEADHPYDDCCTEKTVAALASLVRNTDAYRSERLTVDTIIRHLPVARAAAYADGHSDDAQDDDYVVGNVESRPHASNDNPSRISNPRQEFVAEIRIYGG